MGILLTISCDKIDAPYTEGGGGVEPPNPEEVVKKVLLEDFTGARCPNCTEAHDIATGLTDFYGEDKLIVVAMHAGFFSVPLGEFEYDFRTEAATAYNSFFGAISYPIGTVDRLNTGGNYLLDKDAWGSIVSEQFNEEPILGIEINPSIDNGVISGDIKLNFVENYSGDLSLLIWVTEDGIVQKQQTTDGVIQEYVHNHVFRGAINGVWGEALSSDEFANGSTESITIADYQIGDDWVASELSIVAFVCETDSKRVLQVEKIEIEE